MINLLHTLGLPLQSFTPVEQVFDALVRDKKRQGTHVHYVLMNGIGDVIVEALSLEEIGEFARSIAVEGGHNK